MSNTRETTYISLTAKAGQEGKLSEFLIAGSKIVKETEPHTLFWSALKFDDNTFGIFDTFANENGREKHFSGQVANALNENSSSLIDGGWDNGVVPNISNSKVLYSKVAKQQPGKIEKAIFIPLTAKAGQEKNLANFLISGGSLVSELEPETHYWYALQFDNNKFGIFDFFCDQNGVDAHFNGDVAAALQKESELLVEGGWEKGVLSNVKQFEVLSLVTQ
ncbi:MAG: hypothetical protein HRT43_08360 [Campylobacteraceae bacterium]|nr:hypothetical protein [Campylobacteraceae bacterium]